MKVNWAWIQRRFWDFRHGHSTYLAFALSFINFIVLNYTLVISNIHFLTNVFPHLWMFALAFVTTYPPLAIIVGYKFYRKKQLPTDQQIATEENPYLYKAIPGKERGLNLPFQLAVLELLEVLADKQGVLSSAKRDRIAMCRRKINLLMEGKTLET